MKYFEFGTDHFELTVILHGGGISYRGALPAAEYMARFYHVVLVSYDGFNPTEPDTTFRSVNHEAEMLANYINELYNGKIDILYGISYGCRVLMAVLPCTVRAGLCGSFRLRRVRRPAAELRLLAVLRPVFDHALSGKSLRHYRSGLVFAHKVPFFQHYYPETEGCAGYHQFGFNRKEQLTRIVLFPFVSLLLAWICTLL